MNLKAEKVPKCREGNRTTQSVFKQEGNPSTLRLSNSSSSLRTLCLSPGCTSMGERFQLHIISTDTSDQILSTQEKNKSNIVLKLLS